MIPKLSQLFGIPHQGIHQYRLCDAALIDYILTIVLAIFLCKWTKIPLVICTIFSFCLGIFCHYLFQVKTSTILYIFG